MGEGVGESRPRGSLMSADHPETSPNAPDPTQGNDHGTPAGDGSNIPRTGVEGKIMQPPSWPVIGGLVAATAAALAVLRALMPSRKKTADERLSEATQALGAAAVGLGGRAAKRATSATQPVVRDAAALAGTVAQGAATKAAGVAQDAAGFAAEEARKVGAVGAAGVREVAEGVETVQRAWHKLVTRLIIVVFGGAGYVLGARAGRDRYDQIVSAVQRAQGAAQNARQ